MNSNFPRETPHLGSGGFKQKQSVGPWGTCSCATPLLHNSLLRQELGKGLRVGLSTRGRKFTRGRYKAPRGRGAEGSGGTRAKRGPASSGGTASLEALRASRRLKAPPARANCAQLLPRGGFGARGPATALRGGRAGAKAQSGYPGAATCTLPGSHAPPRRAAGCWFGKGKESEVEATPSGFNPQVPVGSV